MSNESKAENRGLVATQRQQEEPLTTCDSIAVSRQQNFGTINVSGSATAQLGHVYNSSTYTTVVTINVKNSDAREQLRQLVSADCISNSRTTQERVNGRVEELQRQSFQSDSHSIHQPCTPPIYTQPNGQQTNKSEDPQLAEVVRDIEGLAKSLSIHVNSCPNVPEEFSSDFDELKSQVRKLMSSARVLENVKVIHVDVLEICTTDAVAA